MIDGPNLYAFVGNRPTYAVDPWGLAEWGDKRMAEDGWTGWTDPAGARLGFVPNPMTQERYGLRHGPIAPSSQTFSRLGRAAGLALRYSPLLFWLMQEGDAPVRRPGVLTDGQFWDANTRKIRDKYGFVIPDQLNPQNPINEPTNVRTFPTRNEARRALTGDAGDAANRFFRDATTKSQDFKITSLDQGYKFEFFSPANNPGYGKRYVQEVDPLGNVIREYKETWGPDGLIETKWVHGDP